MKNEIKKYKLTDEKMKIIGRPLYRIQALIDLPFHGVKAGDLGGFIESEKNLSHEGMCWIKGEAISMDNAQVIYNALIARFALIIDRAIVAENAIIKSNVRIGCVSEIRGNSIITGYEDVYEVKNEI